MKTTLCVVSTFLFLFTGCSGALQGTEGRQDRIVVATDDDPDTAYRTAASALLEMGYAFSFSDETLRTLTTEYREAEEGYGLLKAPIYVKVSLSVGASNPVVVTYRGTYKLSKDSALGDDENPIVKRGMNGSPAMNAWDELDRAARSFPAGRIIEQDAVE